VALHNWKTDGPLQHLSAVGRGLHGAGLQPAPRLEGFRATDLAAQRPANKEAEQSAGRHLDGPTRHPITMPLCTALPSMLPLPSSRSEEV